MKMTVKQLSLSAIIAAAYTAVTILLSPIAFGVVQFRLSEALTILPFLCPQTIPALFIGCLASNSIGAAMGLTTPLDIVIGSLATLIAAVLTSKAPSKWLAPLPPVIVNAVMIGGMITFTAAVPESYAAAFFTNSAMIGSEQVVSCYIIGLPLIIFMERSGLADRLRAAYSPQTI